MTADRSTRRARSRFAPRSGAWALVALAAALFMGALATPADAMATSATKAPSGASASTDQDGRHPAGGLNVAMLTVTVGIGLAIATAVKGRARISHERSIRRFKAQLRGDDLVSACARRAGVHEDQSGLHDPHPTGPWVTDLDT